MEVSPQIRLRAFSSPLMPHRRAVDERLRAARAAVDDAGSTSARRERLRAAAVDDAGSRSDPLIRAKPPLAGASRVDVARQAAAGRADHVRRRAEEGGAAVRSEYRGAPSNSRAGRADHVGRRAEKGGAVRSEYCGAPLVGSRARVAIQEMLEAHCANDQHVGPNAGGCVSRVRPSSAPSALTLAGDPISPYDLSVCLASSLAKHRFRDAPNTIMNAPPMVTRNDDAPNTRTNAAPTAARDDDSLPAGREYALSVCLASAVAKHTLRDAAAIHGPQISPQRLSLSHGRDDGESRVAWRAALCPAPKRSDPLLQESIAKYEREVRGAAGGKQISPCRHLPV